MDLAGSLAVVTGATEGIGRATAVALGRAGARVAICARTEANVRATARDLKADSPRL
jgi:NAD(P)-dependent dehydrogenase (short-subunit alcohol dehydrogenase family)